MSLKINGLSWIRSMASASLLKKSILTGLLALIANITYSQSKIELPVDWHLQDALSSEYMGISLDKALNLLKGKKAKSIIVGVIDSGVDTLHEDLQSVLWRSTIADQNHSGQKFGWSYLGSAKGNVNKERLEYVRLINAKRRLGDTLSADYKEIFNIYTNQVQNAQKTFQRLGKQLEDLKILMNNIGKTDLSLSDFNSYRPRSESESDLISQIKQVLEKDSDFNVYRSGLQETYNRVKGRLDYTLNLSYNPREIVGDDPNVTTDRFYGSPDVQANDPRHGTHVTGIIAADRNNDVGVKGVAANVSILTVRAIPDGDEYDKDVANAIRYAVDHGAKVINMSFGKAYSPNKKYVDEAVQYAMKNDVLLVHAAGNERTNIDKVPHYPTFLYQDGGKAAGWIEVGASGPTQKELVAIFTNYGAETVDLFAPGVNIYATVPGNQYTRLSGTSMATPVVSGIAALIRSYFPRLTAVQVKEILMKSVIAHPTLKNKCLSGGIVNAARAMELALKYKP